MASILKVDFAAVLPKIPKRTPLFPSKGNQMSGRKTNIPLTHPITHVLFDNPAGDMINKNGFQSIHYLVSGSIKIELLGYSPLYFKIECPQVKCKTKDSDSYSAKKTRVVK